MATYIRLTDYKSSDEKEKGFFDSENRYKAKQDDFEKIPGNPVAYWVTNNFQRVFSNKLLLDYSISDGQNVTSDNERFIKLIWEVDSKKLINSKGKFEKYIFYAKGGEFRKWHGNLEYVVDWSDKAHLFHKQNKNSRIIPEYLWFKNGITWSLINSGDKIGFRLLTTDSTFDKAGSSIFLKDDENILYCLALVNTKNTKLFLKVLNQTISLQVKDVRNIPFVLPNSETIKLQIDNLTQECIDISKEEWDSRETSWDFTKNELLKHKSDSKIETAYKNYCNYWNENFETLHKNEEELNKLFIDIYELQDELTPDVDLKDITILKQESKINDNNELEFNSQEIIKQFISYAVGVMFGRYSLDQEGLVVANLNQDYPKETSFEIDDDNIIPVLEDDYFTDDIASRFTNFVKVVFGEESLTENIDFIEKSLGTTIRKYFVKGFYEDHIKRYKKRPIYWMVSSPKKGFNTLIYMHRYRNDIFATIQNDYLREYITKLESNIENLQRIADDESNSNTERNRATREITKSKNILDEIIQFDRTALTRFAQDGIDIDLDDGVKVNYCKFKDVLYPISGLCKK